MTMKLPIDRAEEFAARPVPHSREWLEAIRASGERGWQLYRKMGSPKNILAPMVDQSETVSTSKRKCALRKNNTLTLSLASIAYAHAPSQAFRMLCRQYGAELCYTPMINSTIFVRDANYRELNADINCPDDKPLIVQFCGNDPAIMLAAGRIVQTRCDAIDINLGCPQHIARRGHYGAFLLEEV
jgi:tRNA-dihydrouridine synthase 1